jgi:hypothetical protein
MIFRRSLYLLSLLAGCCLPSAVLADSVWHWTDEQGRAHFSDTPPSTTSGELQQIESAAQRPADRAGSLRSGEIERLRRIEQRSARQQQAAGIERNRIGRSRSEHRAGCRDTRSRWRSTRDRDRRKQYGNYLRENCW